MREDPSQHDARRLLEAVTGVFAASGLPAATLRAARERADLALAGCPAEAGSPLTAAAPLAGSLLLELLAADETGEPAAPRALVGEMAALGLPPLQLAREALRAPLLAALDPSGARVLALRALLATCAQLSHVSSWSADGAGSVRRTAHAGSGAGTSAAAKRVVRDVLSGASTPGSPGLRVLPILRAGQPVAVLLARTARGESRRADAFLAEAQGPLAAIEERAALLATSAASERLLVQASERRLTRLGYDLHDGPLQELLVLGEELALFRSQVGVVLEGRRGKEQLGGRLDDLDARLGALEQGLRRISSAVHSGVLVSRPFHDALRDVVELFTARTGIVPELDCTGDLESVSASQRLAVLSVVGEALNNAREHGRASAVSISLRLDENGLLARVRDDGRGFDVERELLRAARSGHMGLAGMHERVRLLDGHCRVDSRPGGPTVVTLALPRWHAPAADAAASGSPG